MAGQMTKGDSEVNAVAYSEELVVAVEVKVAYLVNTVPAVVTARHVRVNMVAYPEELVEAVVVKVAYFVKAVPTVVTARHVRSGTKFPFRNNQRSQMLPLSDLRWLENPQLALHRRSRFAVQPARRKCNANAKRQRRSMRDCRCPLKPIRERP